MSSVQGISQEKLGVSEVPNVKYESKEQFQEPGQLKVTNVFSTTTEHAAKCREDLTRSWGFSFELMRKSFETGGYNDIVSTDKCDSTKQSSCKMSCSPISLFTKQKLRECLQRRRSLRIMTESVPQPHEELEILRRPSHNLSRTTSVSETSEELSLEAVTSDGGYESNKTIQSSVEEFQEQSNSPLPAKILERKFRPGKRIKASGSQNSKKQLKPIIKNNLSQLCDFCQLLFFSVESLEEHVADVHVIDKEFDCTQCDKSFISQERLDLHIGEHNRGEETKAYNKCPICSEIFSLKFSLEEHINAHNAFKCKLNLETFLHDPGLQIHSSEKNKVISMSRRP